MNGQSLIWKHLFAVFTVGGMVIGIVAGGIIGIMNENVAYLS